MPRFDIEIADDRPASHETAEAELREALSERQDRDERAIHARKVFVGLAIAVAAIVIGVAMRFV